ncbi:hypothetical protein D3C81_2059020 [compost metagenome]
MRFMMVLATVKNNEYAITTAYQALLAIALKAAIFCGWINGTSPGEGVIERVA